MKKLLSAALLVFFVVLSLVAHISESLAEQRVLKYGYISPPIYAMGRTSEFFKYYVEKRTGGAIKMELYPLGQLGGMRAMFESVLSGTLDMATVSAPVITTAIPEFNVLCLPFAVSDPDAMWKILWTKEFRDKLDEAVRKKGIVPLFISDNAARGFLNIKRQVRSPKDIKGLQIRVMQGSIYTDMFRAMGAKTRTMPFPEVYTALQQGLIEGMDNTLAMSVAMKFTEVAKFFTPLNQTMIEVYVLGSGKMWDSLTSEQRKIFSEARGFVEKFSREAMAADDAAAAGLARAKYDVNVSGALTPEERAAFRELMKPVHKKYRKIIGEELYDLFISLARKYE
jgi:tripartite ATP-independent transporter DctP family solute receptor